VEDDLRRVVIVSTVAAFSAFLSTFAAFFVDVANEKNLLVPIDKKALNADRLAYAGD